MKARIGIILKRIILATLICLAGISLYVIVTVELSIVFITIPAILAFITLLGALYISDSLDDKTKT